MTIKKLFFKKNVEFCNPFNDFRKIIKKILLIPKTVVTCGL